VAVTFHRTTLYDRFEPPERLTLVIEALARDDAEEVRRLQQTCPKVTYTQKDAEFTDRWTMAFDTLAVVSIDLRASWAKLHVLQCGPGEPFRDTSFPRRQQTAVRCGIRGACLATSVLRIKLEGICRMADEPPAAQALMARAAAGDVAAWGVLLTGHQDRLWRMIAFRIDPRLRGRVDALDVIQDAFVEAFTHRSDYFRSPAGPLFLWLRTIVINKLLEVHRHHLGTRMRDANRDLPLDSPRWHDDTGAGLWGHITAGITSPSAAVARDEMMTRLADALAGMDSTDRQVLALRHFEQLSNAETAQVLGIQEYAAAKRHLRALRRLREMLAEMPGGLTELRS
jgi:RNA polymerase sigma-70 factor (ECF subfamily)